MTVQTFVEDTFVLIGANDPAETISTSEADNALRQLNRLLGSYSAMGLMVPQNTRDTYVLTGAASYTIGSGATINVARPLKIKAAAVVVGNVSVDLDICTPEAWTKIADKSRAGKFAKCLLYDAGYPTGTIRLTPTPASGGSLELYSLKPLTAFAALGDTFDLPPGYEKALQFALALDLCSSLGRPVPETVAAGAQEAKQAIARLNADVLGTPMPAEAPQQ